MKMTSEITPYTTGKIPILPSHPFQLLQIPFQIHVPEHGFGFVQVRRCGDTVEFFVLALGFQKALAHFNVHKNIANGRFRIEFR